MLFTAVLVTAVFLYKRKKVKVVRSEIPLGFSINNILRMTIGV